MIEEEIEKLSRLRQKLWAEGADPNEVKRVTNKLEALYEEKRQRTASTRSRSEIIKQARIESELERLSSR